MDNCRYFSESIPRIETKKQNQESRITNYFKTKNQDKVKGKPVACNNMLHCPTNQFNVFFRLTKLSKDKEKELKTDWITVVSGAAADQLGK